MSPLWPFAPGHVPAHLGGLTRFRVAIVALLILSGIGHVFTPDRTDAIALGSGRYAFGATMFGTAEGDGLVGDTTSSGYRMRPYDRVVALPACTQSSCPWLEAGASKKGRYGPQTICAESDGLCWVEVTSDVTGRCAVAPVRDLGPLFVRDNWWERQQDRTYPLEQGLTAADVTARGRNLGFGRGISDVGHNIEKDYDYAAAIDLGPGTWIDLGLDPDRGFSNVEVRLLWQVDVHHLDACNGEYGNAQTTDQVYLRQGPGTDYEVLASLPYARRLSITGPMQNGFYLVDTDGLRGWVSRDYVLPDGGNVRDRVGFATDWVNLRWGPDASYGMAGTIPEGATAIVTGSAQAGFFPVLFNGIEAWVSTKYLDIGNTRSLSSDIGIINDSVNMRIGPSFERSVLTVVPTGMPVYLTGGERNGFRPVSYGSERGWIHSDYLTVVKRPHMKRVTEPLNLRSGPSTAGRVLTVMPAGANVTVTGSARDGFLPIKYGNRNGWASAAYLN